MSEPEYVNRLSSEKSPYLLQHAHNPVNWYPWSDEAFNAARAEDKPIFLSIGYATCHWCHVMERESFESLEIAEKMNTAFICVKVDREELPEIDNLYMEFAQAMMPGAAGWPLNLVLAFDLKPFYAATYIPPQSTDTQIGMEELIDKMTEVWGSEQRERLLEQSEQVYEAFLAHGNQEGHYIPSALVIENTSEMILGLADPIWGGVKGAPKFPIPYQTAFMLRYGLLNGDSRAMFYVDRTLDKMQRGGIFDHLGGGFARYSVDECWHVPHFEKMLYDNAQLAELYCEAWRATGNPLYQEIACEILDYLLRDMLDPQGGFYSAEDADSEGREGLFYIWQREEIGEALGAEADLFCDFYNVSPVGKFEGRNILIMDGRVEEYAGLHKLDENEVRKSLAESRKILWAIREKRPHPLKDDKILVAWNALAIQAFAVSGAAFGREDYLNAAKRAARFIRTELCQGGRLIRRWRDGEACHAGGLDEYAFMIRGLLTLFEAGEGTEWLDWALELETVLALNYESEQGGYYMSDGTDLNLVLRRCYYADGAEPSGNGIHGENLIRLYQITGREEFLSRAQGVFRAVGRFMDSYPPGYCYHLLSLQRHYDDDKVTIMIALNEFCDLKDELKELLWANHLGHAALIWRQVNDSQLANLLPERAQQLPLDGKTTVYICREGSCGPALNDWDAIQLAIEKL